MGRVEHDPRRRRHLVRAVAGDPAVPGMDRAVRRQQPAPARRRPAAVGGHGHAWAATSAGMPGSASAMPRASEFEPPTIIAQADGRDYSDIDVDPARRRSLPGRRPRAPDAPERLVDLVRTRVRRGRRSARPPFKGSNIKLFRLRSGAVVCAYRDEDPERRGVSISLTDDAGESWTLLGQLYAAGPEALHEPGSVCGYPDIVDARRRRARCGPPPLPDGRRHPAPLAPPARSDLTGCAKPVSPVRSGPRSRPRGRRRDTGRSGTSTSAARWSTPADHGRAPARAWSGRSGAPLRVGSSTGVVVDPQDADVAWAARPKRAEVAAAPGSPPDSEVVAATTSPSDMPRARYRDIVVGRSTTGRSIE